MESLIYSIGIEKMILILVGINMILMVLLIYALLKISKTNKRYKEFMLKLGKGKNIEQDLENYMCRVEEVEKKNIQLTTFVKKVDTDFRNCIQKIGMVRYNAFKDTGSDLSFTLALLDKKNDGVVLNGIYSREMSNIYAKPVENGKSSYTLSVEEQQAIQKAIES